MRLWVLATILGGVLALLGCQASSAAPTPHLADLHGHLAADGSSTTGPITQQIAALFQETAPAVAIEVHISGTGGGFRTFCAGGTDISNASRPITPEEAAVCAQNGISYIELPIAFDGLAVLTNLENNFVSCLTVAELGQIWRDETIQNWREIRGNFPTRPLTLYGAGLDSGTYDYFTEAVVGEARHSRLDFFASEDDNDLVQGIAADAHALGFFGLAYYDENRDKLRLLAVDSGQGCVEPNPETVARGLYTPLSRPLFIYVNNERLQTKPELAAFVSFYLANAPTTAENVGYIPLPDALYQLVEQRLAARTTGSIFANTAAHVGLSIPDLLAQER